MIRSTTDSRGAYLRYDLLGGPRGGRAEWRRGAVGLAGAEPAGPPREARGPRRERRHGGAPLQHHRRQHPGPHGPAAAARLGLLHEAGDERGGVREREPVREEAIEDAAQRGGPRRRHLRRQLQEVHLQRQRAHLRRRAQIRWRRRRRRFLHHRVSGAAPPRLLVRRRSRSGEAIDPRRDPTVGGGGRKSWRSPGGKGRRGRARARGATRWKG